MLDTTAIDVAFLAGLFEGEGSISLLIDKHGSYSSRINVSNNCREIHDWIRSRFGGDLVTSGHKRCLQTRWAGRDEIERILTLIYPYLISKKRRAAAMLLFIRRVKELKSRGCLEDEACLEALAVVQHDNDLYREGKDRVN